MLNPPLITLTTDFGEGSAYVAAMKGVILSINAEARIVDVTHSIPPQDIRRGAIVLDEVTRLFPLGTLHVAVVDPGVGTAREIVYAEIGRQRYIGPDNGLFSRLAMRQAPDEIRAITDVRWFRQPASHTFHGRDIMAPAAAHLSLGVAPEELGPPRTALVMLAWPKPEKAANCIKGEVSAVDSFGNLITNITREMLSGMPSGARVAVRCAAHETLAFCKTYGDQPPTSLIALVGSTDCLELAIVAGSAATVLAAGVGAVVEVRW
jgi:S-adenosylmethionine hydrolase